METNYHVTIFYKAILTVNVKCSSEDEAKRLAETSLKNKRDKMFSTGNINLEDDSFKANGVLNMDETWNQI